jgi:hypothetical protein
MMRRLLLAILAVVIVAGSTGPVAPAFAASKDGLQTAPAGQVEQADTAPGAITVLRVAARSEFPKQLLFDVQAKSSAQITSVRIAYRVKGDPVLSIARATFSPANRIDVTYPIDLSREYYPPGVTIQYQWRLQDQSGAQMTTDWSKLTVADPRFFWHERTLGPVTLHWYEGGDQYADTLLSTAVSKLTAASKAAGNVSTKPVQIYLYANEQDFRSALGTGTDQWVGGQTYPLYRLIVLLAPPNDITDDQRSIAHEMTHVAIDSTSEDPFGPLPSWLSEGMAMVAEGTLDPTLQQALDAAVASHHLLSIQSISGNFPESNSGAALAYAESASLVSYFVQHYGQDKLSTLIAAFHQGDTSDEAFQKAIGMSTAEFQRRWEASLQNLSRPASSPPATQPNQQNRPSLISILVAPVVFVLSIVESIVHLLQATKG